MMSNQAGTIANNVEGVARAAQNLISVVLGLVAVLTAGGFIVVNSHLAKFTDIHGYSINNAHYITAGVGLLFPPLIAVIIVQGAYYTGRLIGMFLRRRELTHPKPPDFDQKQPALIPKRLRPIASTLENWFGYRTTRNVLIIAGLGIYTLLFGMFYGEYIYGNIPHYLGGGRPEPMILVFRDPDIPLLFNLTPDPLDPHRTQTVLLLAELTNGVLVADTVSGHIAAVKNDDLLGLADEKVVQLVITPTPMFTPTPQVLSTPTP